MMRSLYSGISGLKNHQTRMDVIGNNIANVNTIGYKASRVVFQDIYSQTLRTGSAGTPPDATGANGMGGTNPAQIGLGVKLSAIDVIHTSAPTQRTDNPLDLAIDGDGFFVVRDPQTGKDFYTRAGNFGLDDVGNLVTSDGYFVLGYTMLSSSNTENVLDSSGNQIYVSNIDGKEYIEDTSNPGTYIDLTTGTTASPQPSPTDLTAKTMTRTTYTPDMSSGLVPINLANYTGIGVDFDGTIFGIKNNVREEIAMLGIAMFSNASGLEKMGSSLYRKTGASGEPIETTPQINGAGRINGGGLEMSNVDLSSEFTDMIVTQRGFQANSRIITVSDSMLEELVNLKR